MKPFVIALDTFTSTLERQDFASSTYNSSSTVHNQTLNYFCTLDLSPSCNMRFIWAAWHAMLAACKNLTQPDCLIESSSTSRLSLEWVSSILKSWAPICPHGFHVSNKPARTAFMVWNEYNSWIPVLLCFMIGKIVRYLLHSKRWRILSRPKVNNGWVSYRVLRVLLKGHSPSLC